MGAETSKSIPRRLRDPGFMQKYFVGLGLDVGAGGDPLSRYVPLFPQLKKVETFDLPGSDATHVGDATTLAPIADNWFDFVHSSHCLEHLADPVEALRNWLRVTKPGGHVIVIVPDWEMYEHQTWPSQFNMDHKHVFTMTPRRPLHDWLKAYDTEGDQVLLSVPRLLAHICDWMGAALIKAERLESTYLDAVVVDQTIGIGECAIEFVLRKL